MAQAIDPAHLELVLKTMGIENVKEVVKGFEELKTSAKDVVAPIDQAKDALKELSLTDEELIERARAVQKATLEADAALAKVTKTLDELTIEATKEEAKALASVTKELNELEAAEERELIEAQKLAEAHARMMEAAEAAAGKSEEQGFKGLASGIGKVETVASRIATGSGLGRIGGILEGIVGLIGGPAGAGLAAGGLIFAIEGLLPKFLAWIDKIDGATEALKRHNEQLKLANEQMAKFIEQPTEEEEAGVKAVKPLLAGRGGTLISQGIEQVLRQRGVGLMAPKERAISEAFVGPEATAEAERKQQDQDVAIHRVAIMQDLMAGRTPAISEVSGMAGQFPGLFPAGTEQRFRQALPGNIEAARRQAQQAETVSAWAEQTYERREAAQKETLDIQHQFDKARQDKRKKRDDAMFDAVRFAERIGVDLDNQAERARTKADHAAERARTKADHDAARARIKADHDAARARIKAGHDAARAARESTPQAMLRRQQAVMEGQMIQGVQEMAPGLNSEQVGQVARDALRQLPATRGNAAIAIQQAIVAAYQRGQMMQQQDMQRMQMFTEIFQGNR